MLGGRLEAYPSRQADRSRASAPPACHFAAVSFSHRSKTSHENTTIHANALRYSYMLTSGTRPDSRPRTIMTVD